MVEPYLGYSTGTVTVTSNSDSSSNTKHTLTGVRLGYLSPALFWGALDYVVGVGSKVSTGSNDFDADRSNLFLDIGANLPLIRVWGGYGILNNLVIKSTGSSATYSGGSMLKLGVGTTILPLVSLNLEYITGNFGSYPGGITAGKENMTVFSVSLPLEL